MATSTGATTTKRKTRKRDASNKKARVDVDNEEDESSDLPPIPVTILSGFLGSGKTTLLKHILTSKEHKLKIAVIVNDMAELNIDGQTISEVVKTKKDVVTLENGCICCNLRGDLIREINRIRDQQQFDYVLIESTGIAEPQQVAESFCVDPETQTLAQDNERMLWNAARLDTCVTVVDALQFPSYLSSLKRFQEEFHDGLDDAAEGEGEKSISELMVEQVEFANIILLNKVDLVKSEKDLQAAKNLIETLNPKARVITGSYGKIDLQQILNTHLFSMQEASESPGWLVSLKDEHGVPVDASVSHGEADEYGVSSFVFRARKPFHPKRLHTFLTRSFLFAEDWNSGEPCPQEKKVDSQFLQDKYGSILRSKGTCWIAGRDDHEMGWSQTGRIIQISPTAPWYCKRSAEELEDLLESEDSSEEERARIQSLLHKPEDEAARCEYGDRRQEIVLIGTGLQQAEIEAALSQCLLTDDEMKQHTACLPVGTYPDPMHPLLVSCQAPSSLFMIARPGQNQHIGIPSGFKLSLQNVSLNINYHDEAGETYIGAVKVWLDMTDRVERHGILVATLRPESHEHQAMSLELMPCDVTSGEANTHRRIRVEAVPRRGRSLPDADELLLSCEVHFVGKIEPLPYAEDMDEDDSDDGDDCEDGMCPASA